MSGRYRSTDVNRKSATDGGESSSRVFAKLDGSYPDVVRVSEEGGGETRVESGITGM